jgi:hypothetical protein
VIYNTQAGDVMIIDNEGKKVSTGGDCIIGMQDAWSDQSVSGWRREEH